MSTSIRIDVDDWVDGISIGDVGLGVLGRDIPSSGEDGPSMIYPVIDLPGDADSEVRALITRWPTDGVLEVWENGSFVYTGDADYADFEVRVDGVASTIDLGYGPGISRITFNIGAVTVAQSDYFTGGDDGDGKILTFENERMIEVMKRNIDRLGQVRRHNLVSMAILALIAAGVLQ